MNDTIFEFLLKIVQNHNYLGLAALIGAVSGGVLGVFAAAFIAIWLRWRDAREAMAQHLLSEALRIQALIQAWIIVGKDWENQKLDPSSPLETTSKPSDENDPALYPVEIRSVLDKRIWNAPPGPLAQFYRFLRHRRTWILRAEIKPGISYGKDLAASDKGGRQCIISSRGVEEVCGWIEEVASARSRWLLSPFAFDILQSILPAVAGCDRLEILQFRLSHRARHFLESYRKDHPDLFPDQASSRSIGKLTNYPRSVLLRLILPILFGFVTWLFIKNCYQLASSSSVLFNILGTLLLAFAISCPQGPTRLRWWVYDSMKYGAPPAFSYLNFYLGLLFLIAGTIVGSIK
jgi:hypothetical protein